MKKTVPQTMLFSIAFFYRFRVGLGRVWGGFGEEFGGSWRLLGRLWGILFRCFYLEWALGGLLEPLGLDFGWILKGWGGVRLRPRGVLEANLGVLEGMISPTITFLMRFSYRFGKALKDGKC